MTTFARLVPAAVGTPLTVLGDQLLKLTGQDTNDQFALIEQVNEPGAGLPPHLHTREDETFFVLGCTDNYHYVREYSGRN
jgi:quercetin dioxygenase-like cupin family protein